MRASCPPTSPAGARPPGRPRHRLARLPEAPPPARLRHSAAPAQDEGEAYTGPPEALRIVGHQARAWLLFATAGGDVYPWVLSTEGWPQHGHGEGNWPAVYRHVDALPPGEFARLGWIRYPGRDWPALTAELAFELAALARQAREGTAG